VRGLLRGAVLVAWCPLLAAAQGARHGSVRGVAWDSLGRRPLAGAALQLVSVSDPRIGRSGAADQQGRFGIDSVAPGAYLLGFTHPVVDSLGLAPPFVRVVVTSGRVTDAPVAIPGAAAMVRQLCGADVARDSAGLFLGIVRSAGDQLPSGGAHVRVQWMELAISGKELRRNMPSLEAEATEEGSFAICGVPIGIPVVVRAWNRRDSTGFVEVDVPLHGVLHRDLLLGSATAERIMTTRDEVVQHPGLPPTMQRTPVAVERIARGSARISGRVNVMTGAPLADARVTLWETGLETITDANGSFLLDSVPEGTQTLVVRSLGFAPHREVVDAGGEPEARLEILMAPYVTALDTVRVRVRNAEETWRQGFRDRKLRGYGTFIDEKEIAKRNPGLVADLFRDVTGMEVVHVRAFGQMVLMRSRGSGLLCVPAVFLDGVRLWTGRDGADYTGTADLEFVVNPLDVASVEVYFRSTGIPLEFDTSNGCGSVVLWTGAKRRADSRRK
jgi:CarboxypepD_reg-like domain